METFLKSKIFPTSACHFKLRQSFLMTIEIKPRLKNRWKLSFHVHVHWIMDTVSIQFLNWWLKSSFSLRSKVLTFVLLWYCSFINRYVPSFEVTNKYTLNVIENYKTLKGCQTTSLIFAFGKYQCLLLHTPYQAVGFKQTELVEFSAISIYWSNEMGSAIYCHVCSACFAWFTLTSLYFCK